MPSGRDEFQSSIEGGCVFQARRRGQSERGEVSNGEERRPGRSRCIFRRDGGRSFVIQQRSIVDVYVIHSFFWLRVSGKVVFILGIICMHCIHDDTP